MKKLLAVLVALSVLALSGCRWLVGPVSEPEPGFFDEDYLAACSLTGMPIPNAEDIRHNEDKVYLTMTEEARVLYAEEVAAFLKKIVRREAGDGSGLIYGMGHAVYTASDPRAVILKERCREAAAENGLLADFELLDTVERTAPRVLAEVKGVTAACCANVDLYSGLIYKTLHIPRELYTPLFAVSRLAGWCAHRIEEVVTGKRIIRPAYKSLVEGGKYVDLANR